MSLGRRCRQTKVALALLCGLTTLVEVPRP